ncbi:MAG: ChbG/HpnK family deacetylase [Lachnospiraceae bacterium]|nr:ChbG/HpnK family deacetylase [Lachnospiraceae bacterium]
MFKLIVNGDDFGISSEVNRAVMEGFEMGVLQRTTWMANMPFAQEAVGLSEEKGFKASIGLHLNLTSGLPLTQEIRGMRRFCDAKGFFNAAFARNLKSRFFLSAAEGIAVRAEIRAQIEKYLEAGFPLKHLDSHHHIHTDFSIWKILEPLLKEYGFASVRLSRNIGAGVGLIKGLYKAVFNHHIARIHLAASDLFGSFGDFEASLKDRNMADHLSSHARNRENFPPARLQSSLQAENYGIVEIMIHPMYKEGVLLDSTGGKDTPLEVIKVSLSESD